MDSIAQQTLNAVERLDETSLENDGDAALYDEAKTNDDGYRISAEDLRAKYGL